MLIRHPLNDVFGGNRARVLEALLELEDEVSGRQAANAADLPASSTSVALHDLEVAGIVSARRLGTAVLYRVNREHFASELLRRVVERARTAEGELVSRLTDELGGRPLSVVLFGSVARGQSTPDSDIDLLVVAPDSRRAGSWQERAHEVGERLGRWIGRRVSLVVSTPPTHREVRRSFWREVLRDGRVLAGASLPELARGA